jgi:hypothetical protein
MDLLTALVVLVFGTVLYARLTSPSYVSLLDTFGAGFLPYREAGWPRGVQESEPIPWNWSAMGERGVPPGDREPAPDAGVEVIELEGETGAELTVIERGRISGGTSIRPH